MCLALQTRQGAPPLQLLRIAVMRQLLDVVYQTVEFPLRIHLLLSSEGEAVQLFVVAQVAEHRFHRCKASGIDGGDAGVALDDIFAGRHLGRLVVGAVALPDRALAALAVSISALFCPVNSVRFYQPF